MDPLKLVVKSNGLDGQVVFFSSFFYLCFFSVAGFWGTVDGKTRSQLAIPTGDPGTSKEGSFIQRRLV